MKGIECLLVDALDRYGTDLVVAKCLEKSLRIRRVGLVPPHVWANVVGRQQDDLVTEFTERSSPVVAHAAGLEKNGGGLAPGEEPHECGSRKPLAFADATWPMRNSDLED